MPDNNLNNELTIIPGEKNLSSKRVSLYRKYRPQKFSEIAGQAAAVDMLVSALLNSSAGHAYLFSGPRGCGKTTAARLLAKSLNCLNNKKNKNIEPCNECENCRAITQGESLDVVEIDGASNNSVDEARELKSQANLAPFNSKYKIYIIDEVHMLSIAAFNALLKIMEEPPDYVIFILATTEPHKVPVTIRSRCQHVPFRRINVQDIFKQLVKLCDSEHENITAQPEALWEIARQADGGMRDALSILEQAINSSGGEITIETVEQTLGAGSRPELEKWFAGVLSDDKNYYITFKKIIEACTSPERIFEELFSIGRNLWLASMWPDIIDTLDVSEFENNFLKKYYRAWRPDKLKLFLNAALRLIKQSRLDFSVDVLLGMFALELDAIINPQVNSAIAPQVQNISEQQIQNAAAPQIQNAAAPQAQDNINDFNNINEIKALDWEKFSEDNDKKLIKTAHDKNFVLYCILLDAEFYSSGDKILLKFENEHCYETARIERNIFILEDALSEFNFKSIYLNFDGSYFEYKIEDKIEDKGERKDKTKNKIEDKIKEDKIKIEDDKDYKNSIADEFANVLGGNIVMVKSDGGGSENYSEENEDDGDNNIIIDEDND